MKVRLVSVEPSVATNIYKLTLSIDAQPKEFTITIDDDFIQTVGSDANFASTFQSNPRLAGKILKVVADFHSKGPIDLPMDFD